LASAGADRIVLISMANRAGRPLIGKMKNLPT
jgi:hypothetical protein